MTGIEKFARNLSELLTWLTATNDEGELLRGNLLQAISVTFQLMAAMLALSVGLRVVSFAMGGFTVATAAGGAIMAFMRTTTIGTRIALAGLAVWQGVVTAAQWAWNIAMTANPIGLIVVGIAALVAALVIAGVWLWKNRDRVIALWERAKEIFNALPGPIKTFVKALAWPITAIVAIVKNFDKIRDAVTGFIDFIKNFSLYDMGRAFFQSFIDGILSIGDGVKNAVGGALEKARDLLPFSDAREGPLSDLTYSGRQMIETLANGIRSAPSLQSALAGQFPNLDALGALSTAALPQGGGGGTELVIQIDRIEIIAENGDARSIAADLTDELRAQARALVEEFDTRIRA